MLLPNPCLLRLTSKQAAPPCAAVSKNAVIAVAYFIRSLVTLQPRYLTAPENAAQYPSR